MTLCSINLLKDVFLLLQCLGLAEAFVLKLASSSCREKYIKERKIKCKQKNISFFTDLSFVSDKKKEVWSDIASTPPIKANNYMSKKTGENNTSKLRKLKVLSFH